MSRADRTQTATVAVAALTPLLAAVVLTAPRPAAAVPPRVAVPVTFAAPPPDVPSRRQVGVAVFTLMLAPPETWEVDEWTAPRMPRPTSTPARPAGGQPTSPTGGPAPASAVTVASSPTPVSSTPAPTTTTASAPAPSPSPSPTPTPSPFGTPSPSPSPTPEPTPSPTCVKPGRDCHPSIENGEHR